MKLMDIDQEHLGIPDTQYDATITMSSTEFQRICRDLSALGESVRIEATKEGVRFSSEGEVGNGSVMLKQTAGRDGGAKKIKSNGSPVKKATMAKKGKKKVVGSDDEDMDEEDVKPDVDEEEEEEEEEGESEV